MLGLSIQKILFTAAVIAIVWYGWRWLGRVQARRRQSAAGQARRAAARKNGGEIEAEEMIRCPVCGDYVSAHRAVDCGRPGCPYGR
jgi:membrane protein implicated in regulation of membrane protease activity